MVSRHGWLAKCSPSAMRRPIDRRRRMGEGFCWAESALEIRAFIRRVMFAVSVPFLISATYLLWCLQRFSPPVFVRDKAFPRSWPYPDWLLLALNDYFVKMYPAPPGTIKLHGEIARVQALVIVATTAVTAIGLALAAPEFWRLPVVAYSCHKKRLATLFGRWCYSRPPWLRLHFGLRTLLILLATCPPAIAWLLYPWFSYRLIGFVILLIDFFLLPPIIL